MAYGVNLRTTDDRPVQIDPSGNIRVTGATPSTTGADAIANNAIAAAYPVDSDVATTRLAPVALLGFNGSTWDRLRANTTGLMVIPPNNSWNYAAATGGIVNSAVAVTIKAAAGAGVRNYLQSLQIEHDTLSAATEIAVRDGAAGTVLWRGRLQTSARSGSESIQFNPPLKGTANTLLEVITLTAVTGGVYVNAQGYMAP